eukprot:CAMPEP_0197555170 /NCGR_PEP_ID=MMETSP1320-20131121/12830_1 /TAXON_ID=91990 /ORGANISM="Bolidomonas sp., Strain RCC2347" /LENGTH=207 /DNA_ID=CAMNT_0043116149 /DNA_START=77 /DNA_END=697 /DNA_ORIENTATION=-
MPRLLSLAPSVSSSSSSTLSPSASSAAAAARLRSNIEWSHTDISSSTLTTLSDPSLGGGKPLRPVAVVAERLGDGTTGALVSVKPHGRITPDGEDDSDEPSSLSYPSSSSSSGAPASSLPCLIVDLTSLYNLRPSRHPPESLPLRVAELKSELVSNLEVSWEDGAAGLFGLGVARHEERGRADAKAERLGEAGESLHVVVDYPPVIH